MISESSYSMREELLRAIDDGDAAEVKRLLDAGANPNSTITGVYGVISRFDSFYTPLHRACQNDSVEIVEMLLDAGAIIDYQDDCGRTPLHFAVMHAFSTRDFDIIRLLLKRGANTSIKNDLGDTPAGLALREGDTQSYHIIKQD